MNSLILCYNPKWWVFIPSSQMKKPSPRKVQRVVCTHLAEKRLLGT